MWIEKITVALVTKYPKSVLLGLLVVSMSFFVIFLPQIEEKGDASLLGEDHIVNVRLKQLEKDYTGKEPSMYIRLVSSDKILTPSSLERLQKLTEAFETIQLLTPDDVEKLKAFANTISGEAQRQLNALIEDRLDENAWEAFEAISDQLKQQNEWTPEAQALFDRTIIRLAPVKEVRSLANMDNIQGDGDGGLDVSPFYEDVPQTQEELDRLEASLAKNEMIAGTFYSENSLGIVIMIDIPKVDPSLPLLYERTLQILDEDIPGPETYYIAGLPVLDAVLANGNEQMAKLMLFIMALFVVILWISLRWVWGVVIPLLDAVLSIVFTMSLLPLFNVGLDGMTSGIPIFLLSIGVADGIHMVAVYREFLLEGLSKEEAVKKTLHKMFIPVSLTSVTTAVGFIALGFTEIVPFQRFGFFVAIGSVVALIYSLFLIPALLLVLPKNKKIHKKGITFADRWLLGGLEKVTLFAINRPKQILLATLGICALCVYGISLLKVEHDFVKGFFKEDTPVVIAAEEFNKTTGSIDLNIKLILEGEDSFKDVENLQALDQFQAFLDQQPIVGKTFSLADLLKRFNYSMHEDDPAYDRLPNAVEIENGVEVSGKQLIAQYLLMYENQGGEQLSDIVDTNYQQTLITLQIKSSSANDSLKLLETIEQYQNNHLPEHFKIELIGSAYEAALSATVLTEGALSGLLVSVFLVTCLMSLIYRSVFKGVIGIIPLLFTILVNFGLMGLFQIELDMGSSVISALVIGIGVDYSIHYLSSFFREVRKNVPYQEAMTKNIKMVGKPIMTNALTVGLGFLVLLFSDIIPLINMGAIMFLTLSLTAISTLVLIPATFSFLKPAFLTKNQTASGNEALAA